MAFHPPFQPDSPLTHRHSERFAQALLDQNEEMTFAVRLASEDEAAQVSRSLTDLGVMVDTEPDGVTIHVHRAEV